MNDDIRALWMKRIFCEINNLQWAMKKLQGQHPRLIDQLELPNIIINDELKHAWGRYHNSSNTIELSVRLLNDHPWSAVKHVIGHEYAHLVVHRVFELHGRPHGEAFKRACKILGVEDSTTCSHEFLQKQGYTKDDSMFRKVQKLLALADGSNEHESRNAMVKAQRFIELHNVDLIRGNSEIEDLYLKRTAGRCWKRIPSYIDALATIIRENYKVKVITSVNYGVNKYGGSVSGKCRMFEFFGKPEHLDIADYVFNFLLDAGENAWKEVQKSGEAKDSGYKKIGYLNGFYEGFSEKLWEAREEVEKDFDNDTTAMICKDDDILNEQYSRAYTRLVNRYTGSSRTSSGWGAGASAGRICSIRPGVSAGGGGPKLLT
jgi:predicted SprT family Zn-dependent metalloprotease